MLIEVLLKPRWVWIGAVLALGGTGLSISAVGIGAGLFWAGLAAQEIPSGRLDIRPLPRQRLLVAVILALIVSLFMSDYFWVSFRGMFKYLQGWTLFFAFLALPRKRSDFVWLTGAFALLYAVIFTDACVQRATGADWIRGREWIVYMGDRMRLTGPFKHSNDFGSFLIPGIALAASVGALFWSRRQWARGVCAAGFLAGLLWTLFGTLSRGALMGAFAAGVALALMSRHRWRWVLALSAVLTVAGVLPNPLGERIRSVFDWVGGGWAERVLLMKTAVKMLMDKPWFGVGLNTYSEHFAAYKPADYPGMMYAHNSYLQIGAEVGLVGGGLFFGYIGFCLWDLARRNPRADAVGERGLENAVYRGSFAAAVGLLANATVESLLQSTQLRALFWIMMGLAWAAAFGFRDPALSSAPKGR